MSIELTEYFRNLSVGLIVWNYIIGCINDSTQVFIISEGYIKNIKLPYSLYILKILSRNIIIFLHNAIIILICDYFIDEFEVVGFLNALLFSILLSISQSVLNKIFIEEK